MGDIAISKEALEEKLGVRLDRFEPQRSGVRHFAQFNFPESDSLYPTIMDFFQRIGPAIMRLAADGEIGTSSLDLAFGFAPHLATHTVTIPSFVAEVVGRHRVDIEVSNYPVSDD